MIFKLGAILSPEYFYRPLAQKQEEISPVTLGLFLAHQCGLGVSSSHKREEAWLMFIGLNKSLGLQGLCLKTKK